jgi:cytidyltransferase-like protein
MVMSGISLISWTQMARFRYGSAHGRFQPLHKGHMEYLLGAKEQCDFLWIGITQYIIERLTATPVDQHRSEPTNNPLTYFERAVIIQRAMVQAGIDESQFAIMPFPVEMPEILHEFLPLDIPIFTTIYDEWNRHKVKEFEKRGYQVIVLWERDHKEFVGLEVRDKILNGDHAWETLVPPATVELAEQYDLKNRLENLKKLKGT